ncbi:phosphoribosylaminoimidazolesuccinocarboxamide synthase [bacterium]|nr:phosphoribosylaminoimidazolesuccinocarboxamide synthase [bacterium]
MDKLDKIYEGKAKIIFETRDPSFVIQHFKDDATAFDSTKKGAILDKGIYNNKISAAIFELLEGKGIKTHFVRQLSDRDMLVRKLNIIPLKVAVRNRAAGSLAKRFGIEEGEILSLPVMEFFYKNDALHDPMINEYHIKAFGLASDEEVDHIKKTSLRVNKILTAFFDNLDIILVDYKLEFGRADDGMVCLADEISPDGCRLWEKKTLKKLDKDRFRLDLGEVEDAYQDVFRRICMGGEC